MFDPMARADRSRSPWGLPTPGADSLLRSVRRFRWSVAFITLLGLAAGLLLSALSTPVYEVNSTFFAASSADEDNSALERDEYVQRRINSYVGVVTSERVADLVLQDTDLDLERRDVMRRITASVQADTVLLRVTVQDSAPERALTIARSLTENLNDAIADLETGDELADGGQSGIQLSVISGPTLSAEPVSPNTRLNAAVGLLLGLALGLAQAIVRGQFDRSYRSRDDLTADTDLPILGVVPYDRKAKRTPVLSSSRLNTKLAESFRHLRTSLRFIDAARPAKVIAVCSSVHDEGRTSAAANLALTLAAAGDRVLLIDADLRSPSVGRFLGIDSATGLTNVLVDEAPLDRVTQSWSRYGLDVLASGPLPPNPSELLGGSAMAQLLRDVRGSYDVVLLDTPPLLPVTDAAVIANQTDGVMMVVRYGSTARDGLQHCLQSLRTIDVRILGTVLTMSNESEVREASPYPTSYAKA